MQLKGLPRRSHYPPLTSLIDVIFLLLLFFMLSSTFSKYTEIEISSAKSGSGISNAKPDLFIDLSELGWKINGQLKDGDAILEILSTFAQQGKENAILQVSEKLSSQEMVSAVEILQ